MGECRRIRVNRSAQLWLLVKEARALDRLGFTVPEAAVHAALQADRILLMEETLQDMLSVYYQVCPGLIHSVCASVSAWHVSQPAASAQGAVQTDRQVLLPARRFQHMLIHFPCSHILPPSLRNCEVLAGKEARGTGPVRLR